MHQIEKHAMVSLLVALFMHLSFLYVQGQVNIQMYIHDLCNKSVAEVKGFALIGGGGDSMRIYCSVDSNLVTVPRDGKYQLSLMNSRELFDYYVSGDIVDTLVMSSVELIVGTTTHDKYWAYSCCGTPCEGYRQGLYPSGAVEFEGSFREGKPVGELYFFSPEGDTIRIEKYSRRGKHLRTKKL